MKLQFSDKHGILQPHHTAERATTQERVVIDSTSIVDHCFDVSSVSGGYKITPWVEMNM